MVTFLLLAALFACSPTGDDGPSNAEIGKYVGQWSDGSRGGLCVADSGQAAFVVYGHEGDANCMAQGEVVASNGETVFAPKGDVQCRIPLTIAGDSITFGDGGAACTYYCGGDVTMSGKSVARSDATRGALVDVAGDPLC